MHIIAVDASSLQKAASKGKAACRSVHTKVMLGCWVCVFSGGQQAGTSYNINSTKLQPVELIKQHCKTHIALATLSAI